MKTSKALLWLVDNKDFDISLPVRRYLERTGEEPKFVIFNNIAPIDFKGLSPIVDLSIRKADIVLVSAIADWDIALAN